AGKSTMANAVQGIVDKAHAMMSQLINQSYESSPAGRTNAGTTKDEEGGRCTTCTHCTGSQYAVIDGTAEGNVWYATLTCRNRTNAFLIFRAFVQNAEAAAGGEIASRELA